VFTSHIDHAFEADVIELHGLRGVPQRDERAERARSISDWWPVAKMLREVVHTEAGIVRGTCTAM